MSQTLRGKGYVTVEELMNYEGYPDQERFAQGPVAVIECVQEIPCDPCVSACPHGAITMEHFISLPRLWPEECVGCGLCLIDCPGQAIFVVDYSFEQDRGTVTFPFEYVPLPRKGSWVKTVNRRGETVCEGEVIRVRQGNIQNRTVLITVAVPQQYVNEVRSIRREEAKQGER